VVNVAVGFFLPFGDVINDKDWQEQNVRVGLKAGRKMHTGKNACPIADLKEFGSN
jgi:hypothetical protein